MGGEVLHSACAFDFLTWASGGAPNNDTGCTLYNDSFNRMLRSRPEDGPRDLCILMWIAIEGRLPRFFQGVSSCPLLCQWGAKARPGFESAPKACSQNSLAVTALRMDFRRRPFPDMSSNGKK